MSSTEPLDRNVVARAARQLTATSFTGSSGNGVQVRVADIRARRSCR
jgi:hypothetical protein